MIISEKMNSEDNVVFLGNKVAAIARSDGQHYRSSYTYEMVPHLCHIKNVGGVMGWGRYGEGR